MLRSHARGHLLDVGAGQAPLYGTYRGLVDETTCIDWNESPYVDRTTDLNDSLPFDDGSFDTVLLTDVLEHLPKPQHMFNEAFRVLRTGGKLLVGVPFFYWIHERPHDYHRYTNFMLEHLCREARLQVLEIKPTGGSPEVLADMLCKHLAVVPVLGAVASRVVARVVRTGPALNVSQKTSGWYPLGYTLVAER